MSEVQLEELKRRVDNIAPASPRGDVRRLTISPTENKILLENEEAEHKRENLYQCCCFRHGTDRRLLTFITQSLMASMVMLFSIYKLSKENSCACNAESNNNVFYSSILMGTLGVFLPSPRPLS